MYTLLEILFTFYLRICVKLRYDKTVTKESNVQYGTFLYKEWETQIEGLN